MRISESLRGDVAVLSVSGRMMGGPETVGLHNHVKALVADGISKVVIDLAKVKWLNSSGLGVLMGSLTTCRGAGGNLRLASVTDKVQSLLMITQLMSVFQTYETAARAVASYAK